MTPERLAEIKRKSDVLLYHEWHVGDAGETIADLLAEVERLTAERDEARARLTYWYEPDGTVTTHATEVVTARRIAAAKSIAASEARVSRLLEALERWNGHLGSCTAMQFAASSGKRMGAPCSCGWRQADELCNTLAETEDSNG